MSNNQRKPTFVQCVLNGDAFDTDIDNYVDDWHGSNSQQSLAFYLGFSEDEYALWVEQPASLRMILHTRHHQLDFQRDLNWNDAHLLAARSMSEGESALLIRWLKTQGYIE